MITPDGSQDQVKHLMKKLLQPALLGLKIDRWVDGLHCINLIK